MPFLLLPFRPASDPSAAKSFIRNFFNPGQGRPGTMRGEALEQEMRLTEPMVEEPLPVVEMHAHGSRCFAA